MRIYITIYLLLNLISIGNAQHNIEQHILSSSYLSEDRVIDVYLPATYNAYEKNYPVLYLLDGEYIFDYAAGTLSFLTNDFGHFPELIIVGIPNTERLRDMYVTFNEEDSFINFVHFLQHELFPFINEKYQTNTFEILYGWSSASGICDYILINQPELVDAYILTGTGIGPKTEAYIRNSNIQANDYSGKYLYANVEDEGPRKPSLLRYQNLMSELKPPGLTMQFEVVPNSKHVGVMAEGLDRGLKFIFADYYIPDSITLQGVEAIIDYYVALGNKYHIDPHPPVGAINESAGILWYNEKKEEAFELLEYGIKHYPQSATLYGSMAELYLIKPDTKLARKYFKEALNRSTDKISEHLKYKTLLQSVPEDE